MKDVERPFDYLDNLTGQMVIVRRYGKPDLTGVLQTFDKHLNIVLTEAVTVEYSDIDETEEPTPVFLKGRDVATVEPDELGE